MISEELKEKLMEFKIEEAKYRYDFKELLDKVLKNKNINLQERTGWNLLHYVVEKNNIELARLLIENGIDINTQTSLGWTPLYIAVNSNNIELTKLLIEYGANVNLPTTYGDTALEFAIKNDLKEITILLQNAEQIRQEFLNNIEENSKRL